MWIMCAFFLPFKDYCASSELSYSAAQKEFHIATVGVCVYVREPKCCDRVFDGNYNTTVESSSNVACFLDQI